MLKGMTISGSDFTIYEALKNDPFFAGIKGNYLKQKKNYI